MFVLIIYSFEGELVLLHFPVFSMSYRLLQPSYCYDDLYLYVALRI